MIPLNVGYAQVAGLPPIVGLYAAIFPMVAFALARAAPPLPDLLRTYGLLEKIGPDRLYRADRDAVATFRQERGSLAVPVGEADDAANAPD
jgi:hypothetical protein